MEIKETATGGVETPINRFVFAHNENAKELGSAINRLDTKINQTATAMETVEEHLGEKTASEKKENNAEEAIKEKKMNAAQTIQKFYRSRRFLRKWWNSVELLQAKETKRFLHLGWFVILILIIVSEAVIIVSNGIEDFL